MNVPADNPITAEKVALGKQLFFDPRLSKTGKMSCESCHHPENGWTSGTALTARFDGSMNTRATPTLNNVGYLRLWYWDGRGKTLEAVATAAWQKQMGGDPDAIAMKLNEIPGYKDTFQKATGGPATGDSIAKTLATFMRAIKSEDSPWDRYEQGDKSAVSEDVVKGFDVFVIRTKPTAHFVIFLRCIPTRCSTISGPKPESPCPTWAAAKSWTMTLRRLD